LKRRDFVIKSAFAAAAFYTSTIFSLNKREGNTLRSGNPLRFPPELQQGETLTLKTSNVEVFPGTSTQVIALNNSYPNPTIKVKKGSEFSVLFKNEHDEEATIHWHGLLVPELMDGQPKNAVPPGESYTYTFPIIQQGGTFLYHSHAHHLTGKHVYKGFAGLFIVEDDDEIQLGLPSGQFDLPLLIQDRRSAHIPQFVYQPTMPDNMLGYLGDTPLINGTPDAYLEVHKTLYRFRLINGSNARIYKIAFSDNSQFKILSTDSGLKDEIPEMNNFYLSPGERVEILFDFSSYELGTSLTLVSQPFTAGGTQGDAMQLLRFDITGTLSSGGVVPAILPEINYYDINDAIRSRDFILSQGTAATGMHLINGLQYDMNRIDEIILKDELEEWKFINTTNNFHPMHVHGVLFQVHSRNGSTNLAPNDKGWKDTVLVFPNETVSVLVKFIDYSGIYVLHCHNLEHEDMGMMQNFLIDEAPTTAGENKIPENFTLNQNFPNPFNPITRITYSLPVDTFVSLKVYNQLGQEMQTLVESNISAGNHEVIFNGRGLSSGVYFYKLKTKEYTETRKMNYIK
jgi:blue copper oxidase